MHVLMFRPRFIEPIKAGTKCQTIRPLGKRRILPGDDLSLRHWLEKPYRSPQVKIAVATARPTQVVEITQSGVKLADRRRVRNVRELDAFAVRDGFVDWDEMRTYWKDMHGPARFLSMLIPWLPVASLSAEENRG
jgi:hypothetical protein